MTKEQATWKKRLKALEVSQADFANEMGLYKGSLCDYLNLKREPLAHTFQAIENKISELENHQIRI